MIAAETGAVRRACLVSLDASRAQAQDSSPKSKSAAVVMAAFAVDSRAPRRPH